MKSYKLLFLATLAFAATQSFAQNVKGKKVRNLGIVSAPKQLLTEPQVPLMLRQEQGLGTTLPDFHTDAVTSQKIGSSANYYTYSNNGQKQISVSKDVKAVSFIFRNNPNVSGAGNSGHLRYNVSSDGGITWAVPFTGTGIGAINPAQTGLARYPDAFLFAPFGTTTLTANTVTATNGQNNGSISLTATGGLGSYTYQILNPAGNVVSTKNTATGLPSGTYTVLVADSFGCGDTLMLAMNSLSISGNLANIRAFKAYPTPASSILNIQMTLATAEDIEISLVNTAGQTILSKK